MEQLTVPATMDHYDELLAFIAKAAERAGFDAKIVKKITLAGEEAIVNVINYAYPGGEGDMTVCYDILKKPRGLLIRLSDKGVTFDPLKKKDPDIHAPVETREIGGLGIFMVKQIMDKVRYERSGDSNILTMMKCVPRKKLFGK